jgi:predicted methyltransferase
MGESMMRIYVKTIFVSMVLSIFVLTGCSNDDSGAQTDMPTNAGSQMANMSTNSQSVLDDPRRPAEEKARDAGRKPLQVLEFFGITPGKRVADISSGEGYFSRIISGVVGSNGSLVVENSGRRASDENKAKYQEQYSSYDNVELNFETPEKMSLPDNSLDVALLSLTIHHWHHSDETGEFVPESALARYDNIFRMLKPGGIFAVIDHDAAEGMSRVESDAIHRIPAAIAIADITMAGFVLDEASDIHANPNDDTTVRWGDDPRDATRRIVHRYRKP